MSKREEATDVIAAACELIPKLNALVFPNAASDEVAATNRCLVGGLSCGTRTGSG